MASTQQAHILLKNVLIQARHEDIFPGLHSSIISIGQVCDDKCIVNFDKHKFTLSENKYIIIEGYREPTNGLWRFPFRRQSHNNKQANIL